MAATKSTPGSATDATAIPLNSELFDRRAEALGATTEAEKAALVDLDPSTLWRFRKGQIGPRLEVARRVAERLSAPGVDVTVDELWPKAA